MTLYAAHFQGPDEIIVAPGEPDAELLARKLTDNFGEIRKGLGDHHPIIDAVVIKWPYAPIAHAEEISKARAYDARFIGRIDAEPERDTKTIDMFGE